MGAGRGWAGTAAAALLVLSGCTTSTAAEAAAPSTVVDAPSTAVHSPAPKPFVPPTPERTAQMLASDGKPREAKLSIPSLGIKNLRVRPYRGSPDDAFGTKIQNRGIAASPYGARGGVGPGGIGNYLVTAHRTSSTKAFARLPKLRNGAKVHVVAGGQRYTYQIVTTKITSFRSKASLAKQSAAVPRRPGREPTEAMVTLSTCRTPEDRAEGNFWTDRFGNPENRIDKIGRLIEIRPA
jgi:sortase A